MYLSSWTKGGSHHTLGSQLDHNLKEFYKELWTSEARHGEIFVKMALNYFDEKSVFERLEYFSNQEAEILNSLEVRSAVH